MSAMNARQRPTSDALVRSLTSDLTPVRRLRNVKTRTALWAALAALYVTLGTLALGARPDLARKLSDAGYLAESAALVAVFVSAARCAFRLSVPGIEPTALAWTVPAAAWTLWVLRVASRWPAGGTSVELAAMSWGGGLPCIWRMLGLALVPAATGLIMLRKAAPWRRGWAGLCAALAACSLAMLGTQAVCARDAAGHVLAWHVMPVAAVALVGAAVGRRILRRSSLARHIAVLLPRALFGERAEGAHRTSGEVSRRAPVAKVQPAMITGSGVDPGRSAARR
jgi:hypothetical protein